VKKRAQGNMVLTASCVLVVANPDNWNENATIQISPAPGQDFVPAEKLEEMAKSLSDNMTKSLPNCEVLKHRIIEVAEVPALEMTILSSAWDKKYRQRSVAFVKDGKMYTITCTAPDDAYDDAEAQAFQFVVDSINVTEHGK
jgi:hypothetical protein